MAAMLVYDNNKIFLLWELTSIFIQTIRTINFENPTITDKGNHRIRKTLESWQTVEADNNSCPLPKTVLNPFKQTLVLTPLVKFFYIPFFLKCDFNLCLLRSINYSLRFTSHNFICLSKAYRKYSN